jgi:hypothetical protein
VELTVMVTGAGVRRLPAALRDRGDRVGVEAAFGMAGAAAVDDAAGADDAAGLDDVAGVDDTAGGEGTPAVDGAAVDGAALDDADFAGRDFAVVRPAAADFAAADFGRPLVGTASSAGPKVSVSVTPPSLTRTVMKSAPSVSGSPIEITCPVASAPNWVSSNDTRGLRGPASAVRNFASCSSVNPGFVRAIR